MLNLAIGARWVGAGRTPSDAVGGKVVPRAGAKRPRRVPSLPSIRLCRIWKLSPRSRFALSAKEGRKINSHQLNSAL